MGEIVLLATVNALFFKVENLEFSSATWMQYKQKFSPKSSIWAHYERTKSVMWAQSERLKISLKWGSFDLITNSFTLEYQGA